MLASPRKLRDTFELIGQLKPGQTLDSLIAAVDWHDSSPQQLFHASLGRLPQDLHFTGLAGRPFEPAACFRTLLLSPEFQREILHNLLAAFPEKSRRFFVHVPRSGGTSLGGTLEQRACTIQHNALGPDWCSGEEFLGSIAALCRQIPLHDDIHVIGHYTLRMIIDSRLARFGDQIWTSMRPPREILLSFINYVLTIIENDPERTRPDTRAWSSRLGLTVSPSALSPGQLDALLSRMIRAGGLLPHDLLCHFLGDGTAESAVELLAASNAEIIESARLDEWRDRRWSKSAQPWANVSRSFFSWSRLNAAERDQIDRLIGQDLRLHREVATSLAGQVSVTGLQVAERAQSPQPVPVGVTRMRRSARPILRDPVFRRRQDAALTWSDPPLDYRTIETTLQFPTLETRIRIRFRRRPWRLWDAFKRLRASGEVGLAKPALGRLAGRIGGLLWRS